MASIADRPYNSPIAEISEAEQRKVVVASSLGTVFEWYDFYLYGSLAAVIGSHFFSGLTQSGQFIFALLAFAAGFFVRPFGAIFFGRLGDMVGRKYTFLITIVIMGLSTFLVGVLPTYGTIGMAAPVILIGLRCCRAWPLAESMAERRSMWPSTPSLTGAATAPAGFRPPPRLACSFR